MADKVHRLSLAASRCVGVGAILSQYDEDGIEHVIAYSSKALSPREQNYSTTEKEALAIQFGT